ncbi:hypothetical protein APHAL10511_004732 [Amanita phalloides]|nr:hypothetical protein APHAL10511_004732 [Amanita phalloides]
MTYSYLVTLPLLVVFNISVARIKYKEGYALDASGQRASFNPTLFPYPNPLKSGANAMLRMASST